MWTPLRFKKFFRKFISSFLILYLSFFQLISLAVPQLVYAQSEQSKLAVSYNVAVHSLDLSLYQNNDSEYGVYYQTDKLEAVTGSFSTKESVYLGTCSSNNDCVEHFANRFLVKVNVDGEVKTQRLELNDDILNVVNSYQSDSLEISEDEQSWLNEDSSYTIDKVELNRAYTAREDERVSVTFTKLPEDAGSLTIKQLQLSEEQVTELGALSNLAYDITSNMEDGSFEYDLTLPNPQPEKEASVKYSEDGNSFEDVLGEVKENDFIKIAGLNHFTVFVVTSPNIQANCDIVISGTIPNTTCFPTIQQAINTASDGDDVMVAAGTYLEYLSINNKSVNLIGSGASSTIIKSTTGGAVITVNTVTGPMTIEGFTIDADNAVGRGGIFIQNSSSNINVENNSIINFADKGVLISNSNNNTVVNNTITGSSTGSHSGIYLDNQSGGNTIDGNTISLATSGTGLLYDILSTGANSKDNLIQNNFIDGGSRAYQQDGGVSGIVTFSGNTIGGTVAPSFSGIYLNGGSAIISGNTIKNSVRPIEFWGAVNVTISDNTIDGTTYDAINAGNYSSVTATNNIFENINKPQVAFNNRMSAKMIDATNSWWGDNTGPYDGNNADGSIPTDNTGGLGGTVLGMVDYSDWITTTSFTSRFVNDPKYVREGNYTTDIIAQVEVPSLATDIKIMVNGVDVSFSETVTDNNSNNESKDNDLYKVNGASSGNQWWRLQKQLAGGEYSVTGEYYFAGNWYPISGSATTYVLNAPTASYIIPATSGLYFRFSDNPLRVRAEDQYQQFSRVKFEIFDSSNVLVATHEVTRSQCDLRQAGNYLLCDIDKSSTWAQLTEGLYYGKATVYTKANSRVDNLISETFTIDGTKPLISNVTITNSATHYSSPINISADASDSNALDSITYYITEPRSSDGACDGNGTHLVENIESAGGVASGTFTTSLDTSALNGTYCVNVIAKDMSASHSNIAGKIKVEIDNTAPTTPSLVSPSDGAIVKPGVAILDWTDETDINGPVTYNYKSSWSGGSYGPTSVGTTSQINASGSSDRIYNWQVQACDSLNNCSAWSGPWEVTIDGTNPTDPTPTSTSHTVSTWSNDDTVDVTWSGANDNLSGVDGFYTEWNTSANTMIGPVTKEHEETVASETSPSLSDGDSHYFHIATVDNAGNWTNTQHLGPFYIDVVDPTSIITLPTNTGDNSVVYNNVWDGSIAGTAADSGSSVASVDLSIKRDSDGYYWDGGAWVAGTETSTRVTATNTTSWTYNLSSPAEDIYTITSHAIDSAGNVENSYSVTIVFDKTIPEVAITMDPTDPDGDNSWYKTNPKITLTATDDNDPNHGFSQLEYQWNSETGIWTTTSNTTISFNPPGEGHNILYYRALDKANNYSTTGIKNILYDKTTLEEGPQNISVNPNPTSGSVAAVTWDAASDAITINKYEVIWQLDGTSTQYSKTVSSTTFETEIDQLTEGIWNIKVKAFDGVGNSKEGDITLTVDRTASSAPTLVLDSTDVGTANLSWNTVEDAEEYLIFYGTTSGDYIYGANVGNVTSYTVQGLGAGNYYFIVRAKDASDNQSGNSNEVNTGTIIGAPGIIPGGPVEDFLPAGEVQGATNDNESKSKTDEVVGKVMGVNETSSWVKDNFPWIILLFQAGLIVLIDHLMRRKRGIVKYLTSLLITFLSIAIFNWLAGSLGSIMNWFMLVSVSLTIMLKVFSYAFIED